MVVFHVCVGGQRGGLGTVAQKLGLSIVISMVGGVRASPLLPVRNATHTLTHIVIQTQDDFSDYANNVAHRKGEQHHNTSTNNMLHSGSSPISDSL